MVITMSLNYQRLTKHPYSFLQITGLNIEEFNKIVGKVRGDIEKMESLKKCHGRNSHLPTIEDKLLCVFIYYRTYITHSFLGYLFNLHNSNICRLLKKIEPLIAKKIVITKDRSLTPEKILKIIADVSEQPTQRPIKKQKKSYSGKKKRHTIKTEIVIEEDGRILSISKSHKGKTHDFKIRKTEKLLPVSSIKHADSGYQGMQKLQSNVVIPFKKTKKKALTKEQKIHNKNLASFRIKVEHKFKEIKIFKIMSEKYRNFQKKYNMRFNIIAGIVNLKHGF
jgi:hypothetical protein